MVTKIGKATPQNGAIESTTWGAGFTETGRHDPFQNFRFVVQIDGFDSFGFDKVSGLRQTTDEVEYREGGENFTPHRLPGQTKFGDITLSRGLSLNAEIMHWVREVFSLDATHLQDNLFRRSILIQELDRVGDIVRTWTVYEAWVKEYSLGDWDAKSNEVHIESMVLANEGWEENSSPYITFS
jgi:phage tail-like protein